MLSSRGIGLQYIIAHLFFPSLLLTQMIYLPACPLSLAGKINSHINLIDTGDEVLSKIIVPNINAKVEVASQLPQPVIDRVQF